MGKTIIERIEKPLNCWICQSWREVDFFFKFKEKIVDSNSKGNELVYVHLDFEKYKPHPMNFLPKEKKYELRRFCPPKVLYFFFSINGSILISPEHEMVITKNPSMKVKNYIINL